MNDYRHTIPALRNKIRSLRSMGATKSAAIKTNELRAIVADLNDNEYAGYLLFGIDGRRNPAMVEEFLNA